MEDEDKLPQLDVEDLKAAVKQFREEIAEMRIKGKQADKMEIAFLFGHRMTHRLNPAIIACFLSGRSIMTL